MQKPGALDRAFSFVDANIAFFFLRDFENARYSRAERCAKLKIAHEGAEHG